MHPDKTRLVLDLSEMSKFRVFVLDNPRRLVIDLPTFNWQVGQISKPAQSAIQAIRQGALQTGVSRIAVDLKKPVAVQDAFLLRKNDGKPDRLVIDFHEVTAERFKQELGKSLGVLDTDTAVAQKAPADERPQTERTAGTPAPAAVPPPPPRPAQSQPESVQKVAASGMALPSRKPYGDPLPSYSTPGEKPLIVLDPGHGGVDPGAIGVNGTFEKHIALAMAKELKQLLEASGRYEVLLTRDKDTYLRLHKRVEVARAHGADLFISLHADSIGKASVHGASIYTLSEKASDRQTARLADRENKADIIAGVDISHEDQQVANILIDLAMRDTMNQSKFFANTIVDSMETNRVTILETPHRSAGFAVLKAPDIPSILIELGFMSNKTEAQLLSQPSYRRKIAQSLVYGIDAYFEKVRQYNRI